MMEAVETAIRGVRAEITVAVCDAPRPICPRCAAPVLGAVVAFGSAVYLVCDSARNGAGRSRGHDRCGQRMYVISLDARLCMVVPISRAEAEGLQAAGLGIYEVLRRIAINRAA